MTKLEQAAQQALDWMEWYDFDTRLPEPDFDAAITALQEALAEQAEQEPVAWWFQPPNKNVRPMFDTQQHGGKWKPLYAAPVRTKDLTDDEIISALGADMDTDEDKECFIEIVRLGIAAYKEKNK